MTAQQQAGKAAHARLRAALGEQGYREHQRAVGRAGGVARQAQLCTTLGNAAYCAHQRELYERAVQKHGAAKMRAILTSAHEQRRRWRIANPTPAEALLHWLALQAGLTLHADLTGTFTWAAYRAEPERWRFGITDALIEGCVLGYACDLLLPAQALAIEVIGGIHALTAERDAARLATLRTQGLTVITLTNEKLYQCEADRLFAAILEARHAA